MIADEELREELRKINSNSRLSELFLSLARDLDVMEAKTPDEVQMSLCTLHPLCTNNVACTNTALAPAFAIILPELHRLCPAEMESSPMLAV